MDYYYIFFFLDGGDVMNAKTFDDMIPDRMRGLCMLELSYFTNWKINSRFLRSECCL